MPPHEELRLTLSGLGHRTQTLTEISPRFIN